jgi:hypothetical protein
VQWGPNQRKASRGSQKITYVEMLRRDSGLESAVELWSLMEGKCRFHGMA